MRPSIAEVLEPRRLLSGNPAITINDVALVEGDSGTTAYIFTVSLSKPSSKRVNVNFATENGSALAGEDYAQTFGTLNFARGETCKTITVMVNSDTAVEPDETFFVRLRHTHDAFIADGIGIGTIVNDDVLPPPPPVDPPPYEPPVDPWYDPYNSGQDTYDWSYWYNSNTGWGEYP